MSIFHKGTLNTGAVSTTVPKDSPGFDELAALYYASEIRKERLLEVKMICAKITANQERYTHVADQTGVPWFVIGAIHSKEADLDFGAWLGNGEHIIGTNKKSTLVPAGQGPFATWEVGAIAALGNQKSRTWDLGHALHWCEGYNGFGYRAHGINSPYLWSATTAYTVGGYPTDGHWDPNYVIKNPGVAAIWRGLGLFPR